MNGGGLGERAECVTNAVLAALLAELTTLSKDRAPHTAAAHAAPPLATGVHAAPARGHEVHSGLPQALPELLADLDERGSRVAASTEPAEMATFAAAMQTAPVNPPPRREDSLSSSGARVVVIRARGHGAVGFVRLPLAADATGVLAGDWRGRLACHYRRGELAGDCSPGGKPAGATFAAVRAAISAQLGEDLSTVAHALPAGASCSMVKRPSGCAHWLCLPRGCPRRVDFGASALYLAIYRSFVFLVCADAASGEGGVPVAPIQESEP